MSGTISDTATEKSRMRILIVDDESSIRKMLSQLLIEKNCEPLAAASGEEALSMLEKSEISVAIVDIVLPGMNGLDLLEKIKAISPDTEVIIITSHASLDSAIDAIRKGAYDYLVKPFDSIEDIWVRVIKAWEKRDLSLRNRQLIQDLEARNNDLTAVIKRLTSFIESGHAMSSMHSISELLDFFIEQVVSELGVDRASIMLLDDRREELHIAASRGISRDVVESVRVKVGEGIVGKVVQTGKPILVTDIASDPRVRKIRNPESSSFISLPIVLSVPITYQKKVLGVINATNKRSGQPFSENDIAFLMGLAGQAAVAIENARQFEELKKAYESLQSTQNQLISSERLNALGQMAAGIAHDLNNVLNGILGNTQLLLHKVSAAHMDEQMIRAELKTIERITLQGAKTVARIQEFSGIRKDLPDEEVNLNAAVRTALEITRHKWKDECEAKGTPIEIDLALADIPPTRGAKYELIQAICNLIFNAVEAMPHGGTLAIRTGQEEGRIVLDVSDSGIGMNEETKARILEPFFTTKEKGHGLGMSIVYGILKRHQGDIVIASEAGKGTTITVSLPVKAGKEEKRASKGNGRRGSDAKARVLVIEDSDDNRKIFHEALTLAGHRVASAPSGTEGLSLFEREHFDLVITDLSMAGISGLDVAKRVKKLNPHVPIILLSGWAAQQDQDELRAAGVDHILSKPCSLNRLQNAVEEVLGLSSSPTEWKKKCS